MMSLNMNHLAVACGVDDLESGVNRRQRSHERADSVVVSDEIEHHSQTVDGVFYVGIVRERNLYRGVGVEIAEKDARMTVGALHARYKQRAFRVSA